jgi:uncharacterized protein YnzC (UPF0291/DUF896 family)
MDQKMISRINELAKKKKTVGLTMEESREQQQLRAQYIEAFKASLRSQLEAIRFADETKEKYGGRVES